MGGSVLDLQPRTRHHCISGYSIRSRRSLGIIGEGILLASHDELDFRRKTAYRLDVASHRWRVLLRGFPMIMPMNRTSRLWDSHFLMLPSRPSHE